jgi:hypothetical protein
MKAIFPALVLAVALATNVMAGPCGEQTLASAAQESVAPGMDMSLVSDGASSLIAEAFVDALLLLPFLVAIRTILVRTDRLALLKIG